MSQLATWVLVLSSCATAAGQSRVPDSSAHPDRNAEPPSAAAQSVTSNAPEVSPQVLQTQVSAKRVLVICEAELYPTRNAEQTLKKELVKWGRFHLVDEAAAADLILVISEYSSSRPTRMERVNEKLAIFAGGSMTNVEATPLWVAMEVGPALGQRPAAKLVEDLRKHLAELQQLVHDPAAPSPAVIKPASHAPS